MVMLSLTERERSRFWAKVDFGDGTGCWEWKGAPKREGNYGRMRFRGYRTFAHRLSWMITRGDIPDGLFVCHHCDNGRCVRPDHLFLGTPADNTHDMIRKGRARQNCKKPEKLTADDVVRIRELVASGIGVGVIAQRYGVHYSMVSKIAHRQKWKSV